MNPEQLAHVFKEYDVRGKAHTELTGEFARRLGWAYAEFVGAPGRYVAVGRDNRLSSPELRNGLVKGLTEGGMNVYDIGEVPSPVLYFSLRKLDVVGGIMITASHNPPEDNGFKIAVGKDTIAADEVRRLYEIFKQVKNPERTGTVVEVDVTADYKARLFEEFGYLKDLPVLKIAVDAGNGMMGPLAREVLSEVGCELECLYCEPDGTFPNHRPDPTVPELMQELSGTVREKGYELGLGFDGDGDRLGLVDEKGELLWGDRLLYIFSDQVLRENPGATIVAEVKCTTCLFEFIKKRGGNPVLWKAGHSLIKKKMHEVGALLGGEMSGHYFFRDRYYGFDDALYAALRVVEIAKQMKREGKKITSILESMPELYATREIRIACPEKFKVEVVEEISEELRKLDIDGFKQKEIIEIDGIRINYDHGWALVRPSNTQAVVVVRCEADSKEGLEKLRSAVENKVNEVISKHQEC